MTTPLLREFNETPECDDLQLGTVAVQRLKADGLHVLVPIGHTHGLTDKIVCQAQLTVESGSPLLKEVLISPEMLEELPTAFMVLAATRDLVPMTVNKIDEELEALLGAGEDLLIESDDDDECADRATEDE